MSLYSYDKLNVDYNIFKGLFVRSISLANLRIRKKLLIHVGPPREYESKLIEFFKLS